jgi:6-phosphogluconate dehydrogenase
MVHNGIEYGMMQALAEGFAVMKKSKFNLGLKKVTDIYNHGSVIESRLVGWLASGFEAYGEDLKGISGSVNYTGEGEWTVQTAKKLKVPVPVIEDSFKFRVASKKKPSYTGKLLSTLRNQFGGHAAAHTEDAKPAHKKKK